MKKLFLSLMITLSVIFAMNATTIDVTVNLWKGEQICDANWQGYQIISKDKFSEAEVGNKLLITVSAIDSDVTWPQILLNTGTWGPMPGAASISLKDKEVPYTGSFTITEEMLTELNRAGVVVKGLGFTFTSVDLFKEVEIEDGGEKGNAYTTIWEGSEVINWNTGPTNKSVTIDKSFFVDAQPGFIVRMNIAALAKSSVGRILANWTSFTGLSNITPIKGSYFEYTLTQEMINLINEKGNLRVSGVGYTLVSAELIDPSKVYNIISSIDNDDIRAWEPNETPKITVELQSIEATEVTIPVFVQLTTDTHIAYKTYKQDVTLASGEKKAVTVNLEMDPGFYTMVVNANSTYVCSYVIGYDPTGIAPEYDGEDDFWDFWANGLDKLADVAPEFTIVKEMTEKSTAARKVYLVEMKSIPDTDGGEPVYIRGYYAEPTAEGKYPTLIHYLGTDGGTSTPWCMGGDDKPEWCEFILSVRGQMINNRDPYKDDNIYGNDYYSYGFGNTREHYYYGAYLDCVRAVDFVASRDKVDTKNIFAAGGSQGGSFVFAAAALDTRIRAGAPSITGHSDFPCNVLIASWPANRFEAAQKSLGISDEEMFRFLSYFDVKNFGPYITCPIITNFSLQDTTDPPHGNIAPYNLLSQVSDNDKEYSVNPFLGHSTPSDWSTRYMQFFQKYVDEEGFTTDIVKKASADEQITITAFGNQVTVVGAKEDVVVKVFNITGNEVFASNQKTFTISQHGAYIVLVENKSFKVII